MNDHTVEIPGVELGRELGHGAHSIVYRAVRHGVPCAVKLPRTGGRWTRSIYREAVALARVRDPALPAVLEVGEIDGLPYLIMELVEGETLAERLQRGPVPEAVALELALGLTRALGAVHAAGLVHRDVKPRNLVLERGGTTRLIDFGFASPIERGGDRAAAGTPGYSAPEQITAPALVDGRADLYAVGRVLFECLAGRLPDSSVGRSPAGELADLGVRNELAQIVSSLLAREPTERYPDARALVFDLEAARAGRPVQGPSAFDKGAPRLPMVGRERELARMKRTLAKVDDGRGAVIFLEGAPGSGKTRLLQEAVDWGRARDGSGVEGHAKPGEPPLSLLRRMLETYFATPHAAARPVRERAERAFHEASAGSLVRVARLIAPGRASFTSHPESPITGTEELVESATELIVRWIVRGGPQWLAVDDAQWADPVSRDILFRVAHRIDEVPVTVLLVARTGGLSDASSNALRAAGSDHVESIELGTLDRTEIALLVAKHLGGRAAEPDLVRRIAALADGTPLGVLEVLSAFLDGGALRPQDGEWRFDGARAETVALPKGAHAMLGHRVEGLPPATRRVLQLAATLGTTFDDARLARVLDIALDDLRYGLAEAQRAGLIQLGKAGVHHFVHDTLRESLLASMQDAERRAAHQRVAEVLDESGETTSEVCFAKALHYAQGETDRSPGPAGRAARAAAEVSLERFDNEMALHFLGLAKQAADRGGEPLDGEFHRSVGEAHLRRGALEESLEAFEAALSHATNHAARAELLGRIAWVHQVAADSERAWHALDRAFRHVGAPMPAETVTSARHTLAQVARRGMRAVVPRHVERDRSAEALALRCQLLYQSARLGLEYGKPLRLLQSTLQTLEEVDRLGESAALARARAMYGVALTALGRRKAGERALEDALLIAERVADPITTAFAVSLNALRLIFVGELDLAQKLYADCLSAHGPWLELSEYCLAVANAEVIDALRGRPDAAWAWLERGSARVRRSHHANATFDDFLIHRARAALAALGRPLESEPWLCARHEATQAGRPPPSGFLATLSWGARARVYVESGELGPELEALVVEFEAEGHNPRTAHVAVAEYYIAIAHARLHQCIRASDDERASRLFALKKALADVRASARLELFKTHSRYIEACVLWLGGSAVEARKALAQAEWLAEEQTCPWVLYGVARVRAHMLLSEGRHEAARDQARIAETLASAHGAEPRARWIREELSLEPVPATSPPRSVRSSRGSSSRSSHQLDAVLHVVRAGARNLHPDLTAESVLDQLVREVDADRGALWFHPAVDARPEILLGRGARGDSSFVVDARHQALLRRVRDEAEDWTSEAWCGPGLDGRSAADPDRVLGLALFLQDRPVGAVLLERRSNKPAFSPEEHALVRVLAQQVPLALEIPRLLADREQLQASLQHAQKMDAVGQLAGGVAHDFNNMLTIVQSSVERLGQLLSGDEEEASELEIISEAVARAGTLTRQLLTFSRHRPVSGGPCAINDVLAALEPILRRLVGRSVELSMQLAPGLHSVDVDRSAFEQAIVNLAGNARDAMPGGGALEISTENVTLTDDAIPHRPGSAGEYVSIVVRDTGMGMSAAVQDRIFEPFFTTKPVGAGTGLGLATVYSFAHNSAGHVEVSSEEGRGSEFRIVLPRGRTEVATASIRTAAPAQAPSREVATAETATVLVVDDEAAIARSIRRTLQLEGYSVLIADDGPHALRLLTEHRERITLAILDVLMPDMGGRELADRIISMGIPVKLLFMSGYAPNADDAWPVAIARDAFMEKPFSQSDLIGKVERLLQA